MEFACGCSKLKLCLKARSQGSDGATGGFPFSTDTYERCNKEFKSLISNAGIQVPSHQQRVHGTRRNFLQHVPEDHVLGELNASLILYRVGRD